MAGNRKLPFGYQMELGEVAVQPWEAVIVQHIFQRYILGVSYNELLIFLREQGVPYDEGKIWNKNMVARILENRKYTGEPGWPGIVTTEQFEQAGEKRSSKTAFPQKTEAQKVLRKLSGGAAKDIEQDVLCMLNWLVTDPQQICISHTVQPNLSRVAEIQAAFDQELAQQPIDEDAAKHLVGELASVRFSTVDGQEYETERLRRLFGRAAPMQELDADLLRSAVSAVQVSGSKISIRLKNGQTIERGKTSCV